jgi:uncharacterized protein YkwD
VDGSVALTAGRQGAMGEFGTDLTCEHGPGRQQVEITATGRTGSTVLANFPVWCGEDPPRRLAISLVDDDRITVAAAESRMLELVNHDRAAANLPALLTDPRVANIARAHSREMLHTGIVGHESATTGTAADRVRAAGIRTGLVLENIARADSVGAAESGLMNSPSHRMSLLSTKATHVGIGIVIDHEADGRRQMFVTQVFIRIPPSIDIANFTTLLRARLRAARPFDSDVDLDRIAATYATSIGAGSSSTEAHQRVKSDLNEIDRFGRFTIMTTPVTDLYDLDVATYNSISFSHLGTGVAQGDHPDLGPGTIYVVLIAQSRNKIR